MIHLGTNSPPTDVYRPSNKLITSGPSNIVTQPPFIEIPVPNQESERSCICVLGVLILPEVWYFLF